MARHIAVCHSSGSAGLAFHCMVCLKRDDVRLVLRRYVLRRWLEAWKYGSGQDYRL